MSVSPRVVILCLGLSWVLTPAARAGVIVTPDPGGGNPPENLLFNKAGLILQGTTIQGATNQSSAVLDIMSISGTTLLGNGGQAGVERFGGGAFDGLTLIPHSGAVPAGLIPMASFTELKFNVGASMDGTLAIEVFLNGNLFGSGFGPYPLDAAGENFFQIESTGGDVITKVMLTASGNIIERLAQIRLGAVDAGNSGENGVTEIPEPTTLLLWSMAGMTGLIGYGTQKLRRRLQSAQT